MAALNYSGLIIASKGEEDDMDKYEDDDNLSNDDMDIDGNNKKKSKGKKNSHIYFKPFNENKNMKSWQFEFKDGENVECLALGTGWSVAFTDFGYIRVFSIDGIQKYVFCQGTPVVTMVGYENLLAIVYHAGPSIYGC